MSKTAIIATIDEYICRMYDAKRRMHDSDAIDGANYLLMHWTDLADALEADVIADTLANM